MSRYVGRYFGVWNVYVLGCTVDTMAMVMLVILVSFYASSLTRSCCS